MLAFKTETYSINNNGNAQHELFADITTRKLQTITLGESSGKVNKGTGNAFIGFESGKNNIEGSFGVFVGFQAGTLNQNGNWNTYVGSYAGQRNNRGTNNTFVGFQAGQCNVDGSECTAIGVNAMRENTVGNRNVAVGISAGERIIEGDNNTILGAEAGQSIRSGNLNTINGYRSGRGVIRGNENTYLGAYSGFSNQDGDANALIGYRTGELLRDGSYNVGIGAYALQKSLNGNSNIAIGSFSGTNIGGNGNVLIGTNVASSNSLGDDNTVIGKNAAYAMIGSENVVIGSDAFSSQSNVSYGSVVIGHNTATNTYRTGSNNIFIGVGADANIMNTSYAISIGSELTLSREYGISVGNLINNVGVNSVLLGYNIFSDSDNCVSVGHAIIINNVNVFNDPLNSIFPISSSEENEVFKLTEHYTDTLSLGGISRIVATASIYTSNIYDSGMNLLREQTNTINIELLNLFDNNVLYYPYTVQQRSNLTINTTFSNYILSYNLISTGIPIIIPSEQLITVDVSDISIDTYTIEVTTDNTFTNISYNLIPVPTGTNTFEYKLSVARRLYIDYIEKEDTVYSLPFGSNTLVIPPPSPVTTESNIPDSVYKVTDPNNRLTYYNEYYIYKLPDYGVFDTNISELNTSQTYTRYIESLYADSDTFSMVIANNIQNTITTTYTLLPDEDLISTDTITFTKSTEVYSTSNIYISSVPTVFDRSYLNIITPTSNITMSIISIDSNISYTSGKDIALYEDFIDNPIILTVVDPNVHVTDPFVILLDNVEYTFQCIYKNAIHIQNTTCNVSIVVNPFSTDSITIPYDFDANVYVMEHPAYGILEDSDPVNSPLRGTGLAGSTYQISYKPYMYNFGNDTFTIITGATTNTNQPINNVEVTINVQTSPEFSALTLNKVQEPKRTTTGEYITSNVETIYEERELLTSLTIERRIIRDYQRLLVTNTGPVDVVYTGDYKNETTLFGVNFSGYPYRSNVTYYLTFTKARIKDFNGIVDVDESITGIDYVLYNSSNLTSVVYNSDFTTSVTEEGFRTFDAVYYTSNNGLDINRYYKLDYREENVAIYNVACNVERFNFTRLLDNYTYRDLYNNVIYTSDVITPINETSNVHVFLQDTVSPVKYTYIEHNEVRRINYMQYDIPTIHLNDSLVYQYNGTYTLSNTSPSNLLLLQKDVGIVTSFHQSNMKDIHIYNTEDTITNVYETSNLIFEDKEILIKYFRYSTEEETTLPPVTIDINFYNGSSTSTTVNLLNNMHFAVSQMYNLALAEKALDFSGQFDITPILIDSSMYNDSTLEYILYTDTEVYRPTSVNVRVNRYFINRPLYINAGLNTSKRYITSNDLNFIDVRAPTPSDVSYSFSAQTQSSFKLYKDGILIPATDTVISFTQEDINNNRIHIEPVGDITFGEFTPTFTYDGESLETNIHVSINKFLKNNFILDTGNCALINVHLNNVYNKDILGDIWNTIDKDPTTVFIYITRPPAYGFLHSSKYSIENRISYAELQSNVLHYIPYNPMNIVNDTLQFFVEYLNGISHTYELVIKNYWSKWGEIVITPDMLLYNTSNLYISAGMIEDNISWSPSLVDTSSSPSTITLNYGNISESISFTVKPLLRRPVFTSLLTTLKGTLANYIYLDYLLTTHNLYMIQDVIFYIVTPPTKGVILKGSGTSYETVTFFTNQDIISKEVFYQNIGGLEETTDFFEVKVASCPYDLSIETHRVNIDILFNANINTNVRDYIYGTKHDGITIYNQLITDRLSLSRGSVYIYEKNNMEVYLKDILTDTYNVTDTFTQNDIEEGLVYYRVTEILFDSGVNKNEALTIKFVVNDDGITITEPNKLSSFPIYQEIYIQEWFAMYNTYESSNVILKPVDNLQIISYTAVNEGLGFADKKCTFIFEHQPFTTSLVNNESNYIGSLYSSNVRMYHYYYEMIDTDDNVFLQIDITQDSITVYYDTEELIMVDRTTDTTNSLFDYNTWKILSVVNKDNNNNDRSSIYLNGYNFTQYRVIDFSINEKLKQLKSVRIVVPLDSNVINSYEPVVVDENTRMYYILNNYHSIVYFRNFNILVEEDDEGSMSYNVILGEQLKINGYNNICIGKNFATAGKGSIIIGNDIGSTPNTPFDANFFNEIFNSIIISTSSFINTKVRDIIAIGNNILNNASAIDNIAAVDEFLAKRPVLIGNNIDVTKLDFHINLQNTFLKTNVNNLPQIYCGLEEEAVCIGYTSNVGLSNNYKVHVNGGISVNGTVRQSNGSIESKKHLFGNIIYNTGTETTHVCTLVITLSDTAIIDNSAFTVNVKFRLLKTTSTYAYYNFENWLSPQKDDGLLHVISTSTYTTGEITGLVHDTSKTGNVIEISIRWNADVSDHHIIGVMEVDTVAPTSLGEILFRIAEN